MQELNSKFHPTKQNVQIQKSSSLQKQNGKIEHTSPKKQKLIDGIKMQKKNVIDGKPEKRPFHKKAHDSK